MGPGGGPITNEGAGGEVYHTIYYIAESPHSKDVIYAGADDGLVHITTDGGKSWKNISPELEEGMINSIDVSPHDPSTVYIAYNRYKFDDFKPYKPSRGESYMNDEQLEHFRQLLLSWRSDLMNEVTKTVGHMKDEAANFPDPADRATQEEEFSLELRARDRERKLIKKIDGTLERISIDDYGYCDACGIEIGIQRLEARPTATLCIDCKTLAELKERQLHG